MKLKGINPIERHVEKLVLGLMALVLLAALAYQFLITPNEIEVAPGQFRQPGAVYSFLAEEADSLEGLLQDEARLPEVETPDLVARFEAAASGDGALEIASVPFGEGVAIEGGDIDIQTGPVAVFSPPAIAAVPVAQGGWATADPYFVERTSAFRSLVPAQQPYDFPYVSVETTVNGREILSMLRDAPDGFRPVPPSWYRGGVEVVGVRAERQRMLPDGSWGATEPVENLAWRPSVVSELSDGGSVESLNASSSPEAPAIDRATLVSISQASRRNSERSSRSGFVPTVAGPEWIPPIEAAERTQRLTRVPEAQRLRRQIEQIEERIIELEASKQAGPRGGGAARPNRDSGGRTGGAQPRRETPSRPTRSPEEVRRENIDRQIERQQERIDDLRDQIEDLGFDPDAESFTDGGNEDETQVVSQGRLNEPASLLLSEAYQIWTHDYRAQPGSVYRYRLSYTVNNPAYGYADEVDENDPEAIAMTGQPFLTSPWSGWSEPVTVTDESYVFFTGASDGQAIGREDVSARAEVYRMYYGSYRRASIELGPGEPINAVFDLPADYVLIETGTIGAEAAAEAIAERFDVPLSPVGTRRPPPVDRGDREDRDGRGGPPPGIPQDDGRATPRDASAEDDEDSEELPEGLIPVPASQRLSTGAVMLDVLRSPGGGEAAGAEYQVLYLSSGGVMLLRSPDTDTNGEAYRLVSASAALGDGQPMRPPARSEDDFGG